MTDTPVGLDDFLSEGNASLEDLAAVEAIQKNGALVEIFLPGTEKLVGKVLAPYMMNGTFQNRLNRAVSEYRRKRKVKGDIPYDVLDRLITDAGFGTLCTDFFLFAPKSSEPTVYLENRVNASGEESYSDHELTEQERAAGLQVHLANLRKIWGYEIVRRAVQKASEEEANYAAAEAEETAGK